MRTTVGLSHISNRAMCSACNCRKGAGQLMHCDTNGELGDSCIAADHIAYLKLVAVSPSALPPSVQALSGVSSGTQRRYVGHQPVSHRYAPKPHPTFPRLGTHACQPDSGSVCLAEKGGDPELVRESQRRRFADVGLVDKVVDLDGQWRDGALRCGRECMPHLRQLCPSQLMQTQGRCCAARYQVDSANRDFNAHNKAFGAARKVCTSVS